MKELIMRIDGKCGVITKRIINKSGRFKVHSVRIKFDDGTQADVGIGLLACSEKFSKLSSRKMGIEMKKPFHGRKVGERVCVSTEEPLWSD
jgi:hypothetical protein